VRKQQRRDESRFNGFSHRSVQALTLSKPLKRLMFTFGREATGLKAGVNKMAERNLSGNFHRVPDFRSE